MSDADDDYYSEGDYDYDDDFDENEFDDGFGYDDIDEPVKKEPVKDESFNIPNNYSPSAIQAIMKEYKTIQKLSYLDHYFTVEPIGNNIAQWKIKIFNIPTDSELFMDMQRRNLDYILVHITFPPDYPFAPPFIRVINPRFRHMTGHVTVGGAICTNLLSNEGWNPSYRISQIIEDIRANFTAGNGRLDLNNTSDYTMYEAMEALRRLLSSHGWTHWATKQDKLLH